jgi:hypothetical protein
MQPEIRKEGGRCPCMRETCHRFGREVGRDVTCGFVPEHLGFVPSAYIHGRTPSINPRPCTVKVNNTTGGMKKEPVPGQAKTGALRVPGPPDPPKGPSLQGKPG